MAYASETAVRAEKTRTAIEQLLTRYGAEGFGYYGDQLQAVIIFKLAGRWVRYVLPLPDPGARQFTHTPATAKPRSAEAAVTAWEQARRSRWRALLLVIRAKLEAVDAGITTIEDEFLAQTVMPGGATVAEATQPLLAKAYSLGQVPGPLQLQGPRGG